MSAAFWILMLLWLLIAGMHLAVFDQYFNCNFLVGPLIMCTLTSTFTMRILAELINREGWAKCVGIGFVICIPFHIISNISALIVIILLLSQGRASCMPQSTRNFDLAFVFMGNFIILFIFIIFCIAYCVVMAKKKRLNELSKVIDQVYDKVYDREYDFQQFITENKEAMQSLKFTHKEIAVLDDMCGFNMNQERLDAEPGKECAICLDHYAVGDRVLAHPGCTHQFHNHCITGWLQGPGHDPACPYCKVNTRMQLMALLIAKRHERLGI